MILRGFPHEIMRNLLILFGFYGTIVIGWVAKSRVQVGSGFEKKFRVQVGLGFEIFFGFRLGSGLLKNLQVWVC